MPSAETYHLTWTCYGQWMHGDSRGWVDREHRTPGTPYEGANPAFYNADANEMSEPACWLSEEERIAVTAAIRDACSFRAWRLMAVNVQPDHAHVLVDAPETLGKRVRQALKDRSTRALRVCKPERRHWWTEGGKVEVVRDDAQLREVADYIHNRQRFPRVG